MLVISRKLGEKILIGDDIVVTVCEMKGDRIRLGVECPAKIKILRNEHKGIPAVVFNRPEAQAKGTK